jgi:hypothetical protein
MSNVKIYEIRAGGAANAENLFAPNKQYFYWNHTQFQTMEVGEHVFFVNTIRKYALSTTIDRINIQTEINTTADTTTFRDNGQQFEVQGQWESFVRFNIIENKPIPEGWNWRGLAQAESTFICGNRVNRNENTIGNNLQRIDQLLQIFADGISNQVLLGCRNQLKATPTDLTLSPDEGLNYAETVKRIHTYIFSKGFQYSLKDIANFYLSLKAKPFVIIAGISGTGKTQLVRQFADAIQAEFTQIPVKPDWTDNSDLIGYKNLDGNFQEKELIKVIAKASLKENANKIYIVLLDEMNLARVEHYFSDFLSIIETRRKESGTTITDYILHETEVGNKKELANLYFPANFYLVGTVNMDETTHPFSRKVLDRANSIELNEVYLDWINNNSAVEKLTDIDNNFLKPLYVTSNDLEIEHKEILTDILLKLKKINDILKSADLQFGYRIRDEICFYVLYQRDIKDIMPDDDAFDYQIMQKILPRIQGSSQRIKRLIVDLIKYLSESDSIDDSYNYDQIENAVKDVNKHERSLSKLLFMLRRYEDDGFTSFWL